MQEALSSPLLEQAHQRTPQCLGSIGRHLCHRRASAITNLDIAAGNLLELEIPGDIGGNEDVGELAIGHEQLWHEVDVPVICPAVFLPWLSALFDLAVVLEELRENVSLCCPDSSLLEKFIQL